MSIQTRKFSEFADGGDLENDNTTVGLESGSNTRFNNPWTFLAEGTTGDRPVPAPSMYYRLRFNTTLQSYEYYSSLDAAWVQLEDSGDISDLIARLAAHTMGDGASMIGLQNQSGVTNKTVQDLANATIIAQTDNGTLTNGQFMDDLANGVMYNTGGVLGADANFTTNGSGLVSITGQLNVDNLRLDGNTLSSTNVGGPLYLSPNPLGALITGTTATLAQLASYVGSSGLFYMIGSSAIADIPNVYLIGLGQSPTYITTASNSSSIGTYSPLSNGEFLGIHQYLGDDGSNLTLSAQVFFFVDGTVSAGVIPSGYSLRLTDSTGTINESLRINSDSNALFFNNVSGNNFLSGYTTTATDTGTLILTVNSTYLQYFTGSTTETVVMPVTSTLVLGQTYRLVNNSSGALTINSSGGNLILNMAANTTAEITCILTSGTTAASWNSTYISDAGSSGIVSPGTINQLAWYAATGSTVSGLATPNSAVLCSLATGVPTWTAPLTNGQLVIGSTGSGPATATLTSGTGINISNGAGTITITNTAPSTVTPAALTKTDDTNVTLTLGGTPSTALLQATSLTLGWTGQLGLTRGGTAANLTASNGGIVYSGASALAILAGTATARQMLQSGASTTPAWSTTTWPATSTINQILYSSAANVVSGITTANSGVLITSSGGVPSISSTLPSGIAATNMSLTTPTLGAASATSINFGGSTLQTYAASTSFPPTISAATVGDLSVSYATQTGSYAKIGQIVFIYVNLTFTPTYTTASGNFQITGFPFNADLSGYSLVINSSSSGITWPVGRTQCCVALSSGTSTGIVSCTGSAVATANLQITGLPTGVAATINFSGWYRTATA